MNELIQSPLFCFSRLSSSYITHLPAQQPTEKFVQAVLAQLQTNQFSCIDNTTAWVTTSSEPPKDLKDELPSLQQITKLLAYIE